MKKKKNISFIVFLFLGFAGIFLHVKDARSYQQDAHFVVTR